MCVCRISYVSVCIAVSDSERKWTIYVKKRIFPTAGHGFVKCKYVYFHKSAGIFIIAKNEWSRTRIHIHRYHAHDSHLITKIYFYFFPQQLKGLCKRIHFAKPLQHCKYLIARRQTIACSRYDPFFDNNWIRNHATLPNDEHQNSYANSLEMKRHMI